MAQHLFINTVIDVLFNLVERDLLHQIDGWTVETILSKSTDDWMRYLVEKYSVNVPVLERDREWVEPIDGLAPKHPVPNPNFDNQGGVPGTMYTLHIPYSGPEDLFYYQPRTFEFGSSVVAGTANQEVQIFVGGAWHTSETVTKELEVKASNIEKKN